MAACGVRLDGGGDQPTTDANQMTDAQGTDTSPDAAMLGPWGTPKLVQGASTTTAIEDDASLSENTNEMIFAVVDPAANNTKDLYYMSRSSPAAPWSAPVKLPFNSTASDETPRFADNDQTLYFASSRGGASLDIYKVTRPAAGSTAWGTPAVVPGVNSASVEKWYMPCPGTNIYLTIIDGKIGQGTMGGTPTVCQELTSTASETGTFMSKDCKTIYFASTRSMSNRLYVATRPAVNQPFNPPEMVVDFLTDPGGNQEDPWLSSDLRTFVFVSDKSGTKDVYISTR